MIQQFVFVKLSYVFILFIVPKNITGNDSYHRYFCLVIYVTHLNNDIILDCVK